MTHRAVQRWAARSLCHLPRDVARAHIGRVSDAHPLWSPSDEADRGGERHPLHPRSGAAARRSGRASSPMRHSLYAGPSPSRRDFWAALWRFCGVVAEERPGAPPWDAVLEHGERMAPPDPVLGPRWFRGARLNFAENLLRRYDDAEALVLWTERGPGATTDVRRSSATRVARFAGFLRDARASWPGDRVAGFVPNMPEAVVAMLAAASIGALWSSCSPDFGAGRRARSLRPDRAEGARHRRRLRVRPASASTASSACARSSRACRASSRSSSCRICPRISPPPIAPVPDGGDAGPTHSRAGDGAPLQFTRLPFDHPLYIMYSSGTTGLAEVHGARRGRHAHAASQGARAPHRSLARTTGSSTSRPAGG